MPRSNRVRAVESVKPNWHQQTWAQVIVAVWRWLPDIIVTAVLTVAVTVAYFQLTDARGYDQPGILPWWAALCVLALPFVALAAVPHTRKAIVVVWWLNITRHRLRSFMSENGLRNRSGRLPWLVVIYPTKIGERAWMWLVGGISATDIEERTKSLGSTCYAQDGKVTPHKRWAHLVRIDIQRRDLLDGTERVQSTLIDANADTEVVPATAFGTLNAASDWAVGVGLPLASSKDTDAAVAVNGSKPSTTPATKNGRKKTPSAPEPATNPVLTVNGEDISDYV